LLLWPLRNKVLPLVVVFGCFYPRDCEVLGVFFYRYCADITPGILLRFAMSATGSCEFTTQLPMISFSPRSDMSLVSTITTRLPLRFIRRCVDAGVFAGDCFIFSFYLLAGPAWIWTTTTGDALMEFSGDLSEFFCAVFHRRNGIFEWWCRRYERGVLDRHPSRRWERI